MKEELFQFIKTIPPFADLPDHEIHKLISVSKKATFSNNQIVVKKSEKGIQDLFVVLNGLAKNILRDDSREELTIKTYGRGEIFGLIHAISGEGFSYTIRAVNDVEFLLVPFSIFEELMSQYPTFTEEVARLITTRLQELYRQMEKETSFSSPTHQDSPYRKKVVEFMTSPLLTCQKEANILEVAQMLLSHGVGSILVIDDQEHPIGIITEKDLLKIFVQQSEKNNTMLPSIRAEQIMTFPLVTILPDAFYYDALHLMLQHNIKHLPVLDHGTAIGMVTTKNLIHSFANHSFRLLKEIENTVNYEGLFAIHPKVDQVFETMKQQHATAKEMAAIITELNERITQKIISFAESEMIQEGYGPPPVPYCWLSLGSEGRKEQTLKTDQDNAIIYADVDDERLESTDKYFSIFAEKVVDQLDKYGFPKCTGGVMASNSQWRNSKNGWIDSIRMWYQKRSPEMIRQFTIFYDFRPIYGDFNLAEQVKNYFLHTVPPQIFIHFLAEDETAVEVSITRFGRIITQKGHHSATVDIKHGGIMHIVNGLRMLAFKYRMDAINSWDRIESLQKNGFFTLDEAEELANSFDDLMLLRIEKKNYQIELSQLSKKERIRLKKALLTTRWFKQKAIRTCAMPGSHLRGF